MLCRPLGGTLSRGLSTLRRSYLYVPSSSSRMLEKSLSSNSDTLIYDLEDSVVDKIGARTQLAEFLNHQTLKLQRPSQIAVRVNDCRTAFFSDDVASVLQAPSVQILVMPKIHSADDLNIVSRAVQNFRSSKYPPLKIVASIESAKAVWNLGEIAQWKSQFGPASGGHLSGLLFAAEDFCADTSVIRTSSRRELLHVRSQIVIAAKAFGLEAIDMVCIDYKNLDYLKDECEDGRQLGFTGKQAIHPNQVDVIQSTFVPTSKEILRAVKILAKMTDAHSLKKGAFGLELEGGSMEMIDAPMLKQAENTLRAAKAAGIDIPRPF